MLEMDEPTSCPDATAARLGGLTPTARADCFDDQVLTFVARSWLVGHWVPYQTVPAWLGTSVDENALHLAV